MSLSALLALALAHLAHGQQIGRVPEHYPGFISHTCSKHSGCIARNTSIVLDAQWRETYDLRTGDSCIADDGRLNKSICTSIKTCANRCALDGVKYSDMGVDVVDRSSVSLKMYQKYKGELVEIGPQIYLLSENEKDYEVLHLLNQEISFEIDVSELPCGMDGAIYLTSMDPSGGRSDLNPAGASYGTGYCDSQCYQSYNFINGVANLDNKGACCNEMDLLEANSRSMQYTAHPCGGIHGVYECKGKQCSGGKNGICDKVGCGFNPYGLGSRDFYGLRGTVDTSKPFTVVTQFLADDQIDSSTLIDIRRIYIQDGRSINNSLVHLDHHLFDSITSDFCRKSRAKSFHHHGGLAAMGEALRDGMVLVMGIWGGEYMSWLDCSGGGPCKKKEDRESFIKKHSPDTKVKFSDIRWGDIDSTTQHP
jgi:cellulase